MGFGSVTGSGFGDMDEFFVHEDASANAKHMRLDNSRISSAVSAGYGLYPRLDGNGDHRRGRAKAISDLQSLIELYPMTVAVARRANQPTLGGGSTHRGRLGEVLSKCQDNVSPQGWQQEGQCLIHIGLSLFSGRHQCEATDFHRLNTDLRPSASVKIREDPWLLLRHSYLSLGNNQIHCRAFGDLDA